MSMMKEFKDFAMKGNVVDMAVGIIIGGAFGKIISTLVAKVIMPPVGLMMGGVDFGDLKYVLQEADPASKIAEVAIGYGSLIQVIIDFVILAFCIFMVVKGMNSMKAKEEEAPAAPPANEVLLAEIRDLLKK